MQRFSPFTRTAVILAVVLITISLIYSQLFSSDFPRFVFSLPHQVNGEYGEVAALGTNLCWNYRNEWNTAASYLDSLEAHGMQAVLRNSAPEAYRVEYYSYAQYMQYQVDKNYSEQLDDWNDNGSGYYYFVHNYGADDQTMPPPSGTSWKMTQSIHPAGIAFSGPKYTGNTSQYGLKCEWYPYLNGVTTSRVYRHRISVAANLSGLSSTTQIFKLHVDHHNSITTVMDKKLLTVSKNDFSGPNLSFNTFFVQDTVQVDSNLLYIYFRFEFLDTCDVWVDWIETLDMPRGYNLFWTQALQNTTLDSIYDECYPLNSDPALAYWAQSDTPPRLTYTAHGLVNDYLRDQGLKTALTPLSQRDDLHRRFDQFVFTAHPDKLVAYHYLFTTTTPVGSQGVLDYLSAYLDSAQLACGDTIPFEFLCQGHGNINEALRNPTHAEISVQPYMALAHGAKGTGFYEYVSFIKDGELQDTGLVDLQFQHTTPPYDYKWDAVQEVFTQLDSIGEDLQALERVTAYCAKNGGFQPPIDSVRFSESDTNFIEVGQFLDADTTYLVLVNRRTNMDRHITVKTNKSGAWALRDLYTQERFVSSTGNFEWIPFDSGQGRVFKLEAFSDDKALAAQ